MFEPGRRRYRGGAEIWTISNNGLEKCDGWDNDCDGVVDYRISGGQPIPTCECRVQALSLSTSQPQCGQLSPCAQPECPISNGGQDLGMSYALAQCTDPYPWAQCRYNSVFLNAFDADHGGDGVLEITLCISGLEAAQVFNGIGIYYGAYPGRKQFAFFTDQELSQGITAGCYTRHHSGDRFAARNSSALLDRISLHLPSGCGLS